LCGTRARPDRPPQLSAAPPVAPDFLALVAKGVVAGLALAWLPRCERRRGGAALLLDVVSGLRLLFFLVASHLTLRHGVLRLVAALSVAAILAQLPWTTR